ncbi:hypothetical protein [Streptosporangium sp. NPDC001681]|uniref:hypothetical protein n=1 Tax=Streptosporangium sp. NPDC001681 TaxID=3154395 RepID=UPI003331EB12
MRTPSRTASARSSGLTGRVPSLTPSGERFVREHLDPQIIGGPGTVRDRLTELVEHSGADGLMALTMVSDHEARVRSYKLPAEPACS